MTAAGFDVELAFPWVPWRQPIAVTVAGETRYACRFCIAELGLKGIDHGRLSATPELVLEHLAVAHPRPSS